MSAPNFNCHPNTKKIYAFCISDEYEQERGMFDSDDELDYDYWFSSTKEQHLDDLEAQLQTTFAKSDLYLPTGRKYDGDELAEVSTSFDFWGKEYKVSVSLRLHAGYYEGFSIDWHTNEVGFDENDCVPSLKECENDLVWDFNGWEWKEKNHGLAKSLAPKLQKRLQAALDDLTGRLENCLEAVAPHKLAGVCACNGEGIYWEA